MAAFLFDADVKPAFRFLLQAHGHDVLTTQELHRLDVTDAEQLSSATRLGRLLITHNGKHFRTLCEAWHVWRRDWHVVPADHAGVIAIPQQTLLPFDESARHILRLLGPGIVVWNQLWYLDPTIHDWIRQV